MKILVYGSLNIDITFFMPHIVREGETLSSLSRTVRAGGKGANQASALSLSGATCYLAGKIANNDLWILDLLKKHGVNTDFVLTNGSSTGEAIIQIDQDGQNSIILSPGANNEIEQSEIESVLSNFSKGDILVLQNEINHLDTLIISAKERGMIVALNPSPISDNIFSLPLDLVDIFFVNEIEAEELSKTKGELKSIINNLAFLYPNAEIIMTAGEKGAYYKKGEDEAFCPIFPVKVVDTTSAGDTFTGYFLTSRYIHNLSIDKSLTIASKASSITVSRLGSLDSIPKGYEVFGHN